MPRYGCWPPRCSVTVLQRCLLVESHLNRRIWITTQENKSCTIKDHIAQYTNICINVPFAVGAF
jgi:hypothetical protein